MPRNRSALVVGLISVVALLLLAAAYFGTRGPTEVPTQLRVDSGVPDQLRGDLIKVQNEIAK